MMMQSGISGNFSSIVPVPFASWVPPIIQNGTSEPTSAPIFKRLSLLTCVLNNLSSATSVAAASELPPARPAHIGIFFCISILIPGFSIPVCSKNFFAAMYAKFFSIGQSIKTSLESSILLVLVLDIVTTSCKSIDCITIRTR